MYHAALAALLAAGGAAVNGAAVAPVAAQGASDDKEDRGYLLRMGLVLDGSRRLLSWLERHARDRELARFAHPAAEHYVKLAGRALPTRRLAIAHPHLLLIVENVERATHAVASGDRDGFDRRVRTVHDELALLRSVLENLRVKLPELPR